MSSIQLLDRISVSRETLDRLKIFEETLKKWNPKINLVSKRSVEDLWSRHILDSVQLWDAIKASGLWLDIGSGGGLPGIIVAILAAETTPDVKVSLVESDQRKCSFLRTVARNCGVNVEVRSDRIEKIEVMNADILSARALADLTTLLGFAEQHLSPTGTAVFPKGRNWEEEVQNAQNHWKFQYKPITSLTEPQAVILKIWGVQRA